MINNTSSAPDGPQITIAFPTYQRPAEVERTLDFLRWHVNVPYEVFILDNSPAPMNLRPRIFEEYQFMGHNAGAAARNIGIQQARAPYTLMLDDDSHPLPGSIEAAIDELEQSPEDVAGIIGSIELPDGTRNASLLPSVFHGCGVVFKTEVLRSLGGAYPAAFCFYGEEYWVTLLLHAKGYRLQPSQQFRICHRVCNKQRSKEKIFYYLGRNNSVIWEQFCPPKYRDRALADSNRRYDLISQKEGVQDAYEKGRQDALRPESKVVPLTIAQFAEFAMIAAFDQHQALFADKPVLLCGCGKFPTIWAEHVKELGAHDVAIADFNPGLIGQEYNGYTIEAPEKAAAHARSGSILVLGHSSLVDTERWRSYLSRLLVPQEAVVELEPWAEYEPAPAPTELQSVIGQAPEPADFIPW